jgi:Ca-activated chloride channel family protein
MNRRSAVRTLITAGAGSLFAPRLLANPSQEDPDSYILRSETRLVLLDVSVQDASGKNGQGHFVSGLSKENFSVFEDGRPQRIEVFDHGDPPVTVGILVDESRSMAPKRPAVLTAALSFIGESNPEDEIFVLNFNDKVTPGLPSPQLFSDDVQQLRTALFRGVSEGRTALYDAVVDGLAQLKLGKRDKKTLVLISDGGDNCSTHTRRQTLDRVDRSVATIYTIGLFDENDGDRDPGVLRDLARISGGEAYFPPSPAEMVPTCHRIARDIRARYTLGYIPAAGKGANSVRNIHVGASAPGHSKLIARTRPSYHYDQIESQNRK